MDTPTDTVSRNARHSKSCQRCRRRKQRCHGFPICNNCQAAKKTCIQSEFAIELHKSSPEAAAFERIKILEGKLAAALAREEEYRKQAHSQIPLNRPTTSSLGGTSQNTAHQSQQESGRSITTRIADTVGFLSLGDSHSREPTYVGSSSGFSLAANLGQLVQATVWRKALASTVADDNPQQLNLAELQAGRCDFPDDKMGSRIIAMYFNKVHQRYPLLDRSEMLNLHARRHSLGSASFQEQYNIFKLYMIYAIGSTLLKLTESYNGTSPEKYFITAMQYIASARESHSVHNAEAMVLLVLYNLRSPSNSGIWYMIGLAMRTSIDLGMHREAHYASLTPYQGELRRRLFWSVYMLDRVIAISLGRPVNLSDQDIDVKLPLDVDDTLNDNDRIASLLANANSDGLPARRTTPTTSLTFWTELLKLKRIESQIQCHIYRVDRSIESLKPEVAPLLSRLEEWKSYTPNLTLAENNYLDLLWNKATRLLLQPFLGILDPNDGLIKRCLTASGQICQIFKRMFQQDSYGHSFISVHSIFIAGVNICYCLCLNPSLWTMTVSNDLRACSSALFVMAERTPRVKKYRDVLETVITGAMDFVSKNTDPSLPNNVPQTQRSSSAISSHEQQAVQSLLGLSTATQSNNSNYTGPLDISQLLQQSNERAYSSGNSWQHTPTQEESTQQLLRTDIHDWPMEPLFDFQWQNDQVPDETIDTSLQVPYWQLGSTMENVEPPVENVWAGDRYGLQMINQLLSLDANESSIPLP